MLHDTASLEFCYVPGPTFEPLDRLDDNATVFHPAKENAPQGWKASEQGLYRVLTPPKVDLPDQGWKIHVSSTLENAVRVLDLVWNYCIAEQLHFKFLRSSQALHLFNSKTWDRASSGKFIAIYPTSVASFEKHILNLSIILDGFDGPYILTDIRLKGGPLYARYGAFKAIRSSGADQAHALTMRNPAGELIPDTRSIPFSPPDFLELPAVLSISASSAPQPGEDRIKINSSIKFSNSGGLYLATDAVSGGLVRVREARPFTGLDGEKRDAFDRIEHEEKIIRHLSGVRGVPGFVCSYKKWEHRFLAVDFIDGTSLLELIVEKYPLTRPELSPRSKIGYLDWVGQICQKLFDLIFRVHQHGVYLGDIHPSNIVVTKDGSVYFIDFENSGFISDEYCTPGLIAEGFFTGKLGSGIELDYAAFRRVVLMLLLPIVPILSLDAEKEKSLWAYAGKFFDGIHKSVPAQLEIPYQYLRRFSGVEGGTDSDLKAQDLLLDGILSRADYSRQDRLFPADPRVSVFGGASLGYGAAGVVLAFASCGYGLPEEVSDWILRSVNAGGATGAGFYDGPLGVAYAFGAAGRLDFAEQILESYVFDRDGPYNDSFFSGNAGSVAALLGLDRELNDLRCMQIAMDRANTLWKRAVDHELGFVRGKIGLMFGRSGVAVSLIRAFKASGDKKFLGAARVLIDSEISEGRFLPDGDFHLVLGGKNLPYLDSGSCGLAMALCEVLTVEYVEEYEATMRGIERACAIPFVMQAGLFEGRAGISVAAAFIGQHEAAKLHLEKMDWYCVNSGGKPAFAGRGLTRISDDLATGTAGVILALATSARSDRAAVLTGDLGVVREW